MPGTRHCHAEVHKQDPDSSREQIHRSSNRQCRAVQSEHRFAHRPVRAWDWHDCSLCGSAHCDHADRKLPHPTPCRRFPRPDTGHAAIGHQSVDHHQQLRLSNKCTRQQRQVKTIRHPAVQPSRRYFLSRSRWSEDRLHLSGPDRQDHGIPSSPKIELSCK